MDEVDGAYFEGVIRPLLTGEIEFVGEIAEEQKDEFLGAAAALLFPIDWPEPFGLVMIEAAARGTPVLAYPRGSVREVIEEGVTGMLVDGVDEAIEALPSLLALSRAEVRRAVEERFSVARMARDYVEVYGRLMTAPQPDDPVVVAIGSGQPLTTAERAPMADLAQMNGGTVPDPAPTNG